VEDALKMVCMVTRVQQFKILQIC